MRVAMVICACAAAIACAPKRPPLTLPNDPSAAGFAFARVIPRPRSVDPAPGRTFTITPQTAVTVSPDDERIRWIGTYLANVIGLAAAEPPPAVAVAEAATSGNIALLIDTAAFSSDESYELIVAPDRVTVRARHAAGLFYGVQTFRQLLPDFVEYEAVRPNKSRPVTAAAGRIRDEPRFGWRGAMLDVSRHFFGVDDVKRFIDLIALYKLNRLHLHLSDDQGWRIEIRKWPELTRRGGATEVGGGEGGFYTQEQYAELARYAADRFITIVPEIDMPGHTNAALASYADLNCDNVLRSPYTGIQVGFSALCVEKESTYAFLDDVIGEIAAMTPGPWFHIGGDEVNTLSAEQYTAFVERVQAIVVAKGKQTIGWDEITSARLHPTTMVQHWRPRTSPAQAVSQGANVIMSMANRVYLDMKYDESTPIGLNWAGFIDVRTAYDWDPATAAAGVPEAALAGVEAPLWSETTATLRDVEFLAFPRLLAVAEVAWSTASRDWESFRRRLAAHAGRLTALGVNFSRAPGIPWP